MSLLDLWSKTPDQLKDKKIYQLITFAGAGKLIDGSDCSKELRAFLASVPSQNLEDYTDQCLSHHFTDSGLALQDVINEVGARIGAEVTPGLYRGTPGKVGFDGCWKLPNGQSIIVEVKTTDAFRIDLNTIDGYRKVLIESQSISEKESSILLIVGREDTGDLEAQIRGSRFAWDIRIISVDALLRLMFVKEEVEDPQILQRIHNILIPREFTRLDEIVDILFSATEEIKQEDMTPEEESLVDRRSKEPKFAPVAFHDACILRIQNVLGKTLVKRSRALFSSPDKSIAVSCAVSKEYNPDTKPGYWFAFHQHQKEVLKGTLESYIEFGCGTSKRLLLIPFSNFEPWLEGMGTTKKDNQCFWHVLVDRENDKYILHRKKGSKNIDLTQYLVSKDF